MLRREKRQHRRVLVSVEAELKLATQGGSITDPAPLRGLVTNLSTMGLSVRLPEVHPNGTMFRVRLRIGEESCFFFAAVRRVYPASAQHPSHFGHGLQIIAAPEASIYTILQHMDRMAARGKDAALIEAFDPAELTVPVPSIADQPSFSPRASS